MAAVDAAIRQLGPVDASGHRVVHGGTRLHRPGTGRRRRHGSDGRARRAGAPPSAGRDRRDRGRPPGPARCAGGRLLRHRVPRHAPARRLDLCPAGRVAGTLGDPSLRLPRAVARLRRPAGHGAPGRRPGGPADRHLPSRRRRVAGRGPRRPVGGHDDGVHAARGPRHGDAVWQRRPGPRAVAGRSGRAIDGGDRRRARARVGHARARRHGGHARDPRPRRGRRRARRRSLSTSTSIACGRRSPR